MTEEALTTISVKVKSVKDLETFKIHPRQPLYEVIEMIIEKFKKTHEKKEDDC